MDCEDHHDSNELKVLKVQDPPKEKIKPLNPILPQPPSLLLMISPIRTGKCLCEWSLVECKDSLKYIKDVSVGDYVNSVNGFVKVLNVFNQGTKECYKVKIDTKELIITKDHKLQTYRGMKPLEEISSEKIITKNGNHIISNISLYGDVRCYDLEIDHPDHTFYCNDISVSNSTIISNLLLNSNFYGQDYFDKVMCISPTIYNDKTSRFLKKAFDCYDEYSDGLIQELIQTQTSFDDPNDRPDVAVILDDIIGMIRREAYLNHLASRFRHYNIKLLLMSSQNYRAVSPIIRSNATHMIIGSPFPNNKELGKIAEEMGDQFGGQDNFLRIYHAATPEKYDFLYLRLDCNPPEAWHKFDKLIAYGGQKNELEAPEGMVDQIKPKTDDSK
jgi:hypothetical protein